MNLLQRFLTTIPGTPNKTGSAMKATDDVKRILDDDAFWAAIEAEFAAGTASATREIFIAGAESTARQGVIVDFDAIHQAALRVTRETSSLYWRLMTQTTRDALREALTTWQESGLGTRGLPDLISALEPLFDRARAKRIAVTETTRIFAEGNRAAMAQDDAVLGEEWQTAVDELVCDRCGPLHLLIFPKGQGPQLPLHPGCRCAVEPATEAYVRQHVDRWQGPPLPPREGE